MQELVNVVDVVQGLVNVQKFNITQQNWGDNLQDIFEGDVQNPHKGTFTNPCCVEDHLFVLNEL